MNEIKTTALAENEHVIGVTVFNEQAYLVTTKRLFRVDGDKLVQVAFPD